MSGEVVDPHEPITFTSPLMPYEQVVTKVVIHVEYSHQ